MSTIQPSLKQGRVITSERKTVEINFKGETLVVGERINPTGKKKLQEELRNNKLDMIADFATEQIKKGAKILDINLGMNGIDEKTMMVRVIEYLSRLVDVPLCIDSSNVEVIEAALRIYPGRALVNSISLEEVKIKQLLPIAAKYGAMFVLLPLSDEGLPKSKQDKIRIIEEVITEAKKYGYTAEDIVVDGLVTTVASNPLAAKETLEVIYYCTNDLNMATIVGLSNISFGLPERKYVNSAFLSMAIQNGLTMAIANPSSELLMMTLASSDVLTVKDKDSMRYISNANRLIKLEEKPKPEITDNVNQRNEIFEAVLKGNKEGIIDLIKNSLSENIEPKNIIDNYLIPAINEVGHLFDEQIYFLPQLIASAEAMKKGIEFLEPMLKQGGSNEQDKKQTIIMATVQGDIHDIGKNLVVLMLKNHGYNVIDLGKDVSCELIIKKAKESNADIIGLSALMTTTMVQMKVVVDAVKEAKLKTKVIIGGAVITQSYADEIGADGYSKDAADAVKLVKRLI